MKKKAFTLIELVVVLACISILATVGYNFYHKAIDQIRQSKALVVLKQIHGAFRMYYSEMDNAVPTDLDHLINFGFGTGGGINDTSDYFTYSIVSSGSVASISPIASAASDSGYTVDIRYDGSFFYSSGAGPGLP